MIRLILSGIAITNVVSATVLAQDCKHLWDVSVGNPGFDYEVASLAVHDDGGGPALFAGGRFRNAGGVQAWRIAQWNGVFWLPLDTGIGGGLDDFASYVYAMASFDDGHGPGLFAAGYFRRAGTVLNADSIAVWRDGTWSSVGGGVSAAGGSLGLINALTVFDDGTGPALYAAGTFERAGFGPALSIAKWDGHRWSSLGLGLLGRVHSLAVYDNGGGPALFVAGDFQDPAGRSSVAITKWNGRTWERMSGGTPSGEWVNYSPCPIGRFCPVYVPPRGDALIAFDPGLGESLFLAGSFNRARTVKLDSPAQWNGSRWMNLPGGAVDGRILTLATHDDGLGDALFAGGFVTMAGGETASGIAKWEVSYWQPLGSGVSPGPVHAMTSFDDGSGPALYVAGNFSLAGGKSTENIARWMCKD